MFDMFPGSGLFSDILQCWKMFSRLWCSEVQAWCRSVQFSAAPCRRAARRCRALQNRATPCSAGVYSALQRRSKPAVWRRARDTDYWCLDQCWWNIWTGLPQMKTINIHRKLLQDPLKGGEGRMPLNQLESSWPQPLPKDGPWLKISSQ